MTAVPTRHVLASGLEISRVVTGLWQIADMERGGPLDLDATADAMVPYVEAGFTTFDMADHYGSAEDIVGRFVRRHGASRPVQLLTKWVPPPGPVTRVDVQAAVQRSLTRMRLEQLDLLQFHAWSWAHPGWLDCLFWLHELQGAGLIRHLGVTNFDTAHLRVALASGIPIACNQVSFSLLDRRPSGAMAALCREQDVALLAYGTVAGGLLNQRWLGQPAPAVNTLKTWSEMKYRRFIDAAGGWDAFQGLLGLVHQIAGRTGLSMANVACRYVLDEPAVAAVIIGARLGRSEHLRDNRRLLEGPLDQASRRELDGAVARLTPIPGDCGDEYRRPPHLTAAGDLSHHPGMRSTPYEARTGPDGRVRVASGTVWEELAGYSRAVRQGNRVWVSGTTATHRDRLIGGADPAAQTHFVIDKIEGALLSAGARLEDVVRTRVFVSRMQDWEAVARAHGERFRLIRPANTLVEAALVGDGLLVEMEAEAVVPTAPANG